MEEPIKLEKVLGKITSAEYGTIDDYPFLIGIHLGFSVNGGGISTGGKYTVNISKTCKWGGLDREKIITASVEKVAEILRAAKVNYVSELIGKPVEITIDRNSFMDFRILQEVL